MHVSDVRIEFVSPLSDGICAGGGNAGRGGSVSVKKGFGAAKVTEVKK